MLIINKILYQKTIYQLKMNIFYSILFKEVDNREFQP